MEFNEGDYILWIPSGSIEAKIVSIHPQFITVRPVNSNLYLDLARDHVSRYYRSMGPLNTKLEKIIYNINKETI
jgi:hypothetical protein